MRKLLFICSFFAVLILSGSINNPWGTLPLSAEANVTQAMEYQIITSAQARQMMDDGHAFILLDVRTTEEFETERIEGALLIPVHEVKERAQAELPDKNARILVYCRSGRRSAQAAHDLINMGYANVYDFGGIIDWPYETVSD